MSNRLHHRCENCGQPATDTDVVCFHCGQPLPGREEITEPAVNVQESWQQSISPTAAVVYIGIALIVFVSFVLVTRMLGQRPLVQIGFATRPADGWRQVVNQDEEFFLYLPENWLSYDVGDSAQAEELARHLDKSDLYYVATQPLASLADDLQIIYLSQNGNPEVDRPFAFLVVAKSNLLNSLSYEEVNEFLSGDPTIDDSVNFVDDFTKSRVEAIVQLPKNLGDVEPEGETLRCRQQFVLGVKESFIMALCSPSERYISYSSTFEEISNSFQRLEK